MSFYELEHGYFLYMDDLEKLGYICKNRDDIFKVVRKDIKGITYIKINRAEYAVIDAILRGEDTEAFYSKPEEQDAAPVEERGEEGGDRYGGADAVAPEA